MSESKGGSLAVVDYWPRHDPSSDPIAKQFLAQGLSLGEDVRTTDLTLASVFGRKHWNARGRVVLFSGEAYFRDEFADYTVDCRFSGASNHFRFPLWAYNCMGAEGSSLSADPTRERRRFCNFTYSNPRSQIRNAFFELLNAKKPVDSLGSLMNNRVDTRLAGRTDLDWHSTKNDVLSDYRFTIAFENTELPGYTTEKIVDAWLAGSVPIYWGNPAFTIDFTPDSCLSLYEAGSLDKLVAQVLEAENEPERYAQLQAANPFRTGAVEIALNQYRTGLSAFVDMVMEEMREPPQRHLRSRRSRTLATVKLATRKLTQFTRTF